MKTNFPSNLARNVTLKINLWKNPVTLTSKNNVSIVDHINSLFYEDDGTLTVTFNSCQKIKFRILNDIYVYHPYWRIS